MNLIHTHIIGVFNFDVIFMQMTRVNGHRSMSLFSRVKTPDLKLIFIPLIFLLLRIWGAIVDIPSYYMSEHVREDFRKRHVVAVLIFFGVSYMAS